MGTTPAQCANLQRVPSPFLHRWYRRAALVMWARSRRFSILAGTNIAGAICQLGASLAAGEPRAECAAFVSAILDHLQRKAAAPALGYAAPFHGSLSTYSDIYPSGVAANSLAQLMGSIAELAALEAAAVGGAAGVADAKVSTAAAAEVKGSGAGVAASHSAAAMAARCLTAVLPGRLQAAQHADPTIRLCNRLGWAAMQPALQELLQACFGRPDKRAEAVALLLSLCEHAAKAATAPGAAGAAAEQACVAGFCQLAVSKVCAAIEEQRGQQQRAGMGPAHRQAALQPAAMAQLLKALAALGGGPQLALAQRLLPHAMADVDASTVQALLLLQRRFGWAAVRPAAQRIVADCQADSGRLPHSMALLRELAEAAGESSTGGASSRGSAKEQQQAMPTAAAPVAAPGKENASTSQQPRHEQAAAVPTNQKEQQQQAELQAELASLLAAALDVALQEADSPEQGARLAVQPPQYSWQAQQTNQAQQAQRTRSAAFVADAFRAVWALLPAVGAAPVLPATVGGLPLTGLADRLALLATRLGQLHGQYPADACLAAACKQLHEKLGREAAAGVSCSGESALFLCGSAGDRPCAAARQVHVCFMVTHGCGFCCSELARARPCCLQAAPRCWR